MGLSSPTIVNIILVTNSMTSILLSMTFCLCQSETSLGIQSQNGNLNDWSGELSKVCDVATGSLVLSTLHFPNKTERGMT